MKNVLLILLFAPLTLFAATTLNDLQNNAVVKGPVPKGYDPSKVQLMGNDVAMLGLDSDAKAFLLKRTSTSPEGVKGLNADFSNRLAKFIQGAEGAGHRISIYSGYRSEAHQAQLFRNAVLRYGSVAAARKWVAPPGKSNHGGGIAADLKFSSAAARQWAHANAAAYGLRFRMAHEPWHIEPSGGVTPGGEGSGGGETPTAGGGAPASGQRQQAIPQQNAQPEQQTPSGDGAGGSRTPPANQFANKQNPYTNLWNQLWGIKDTAEIQCSPEQVTQGEKVAISWKCSGESKTSAGKTDREGVSFVTNGLLSGSGYASPTSDTIYSLQCLGDIGQVLAEDNCNVTVAQHTQVAATQFFMGIKASPTSIFAGNQAEVMWVTSGTSNCTVWANGESVGSGITGSFYTGSLSVSTIYALVCDAPSGRYSKRITVTVE